MFKIRDVSSCPDRRHRPNALFSLSEGQKGQALLSFLPPFSSPSLCSDLLSSSKLKHHVRTRSPHQHHARLLRAGRTSCPFFDLFSPPITLTRARPSHRKADHKIAVGSGGLNFDPSSVSADVGGASHLFVSKRCARIDDLSLREPFVVDTVTFSFPSSTHTATLSTFANPCVANSVSAFNAKGPGDVVFDVTSTNASWFFCATQGHVGHPHLDLLARVED